MAGTVLRADAGSELGAPALRTVGPTPAVGSVLLRSGLTPAVARGGLAAAALRACDCCSHAAGICGGCGLRVVIKSIFRLSALQESASATRAPAALAPPVAWPIPLALLVRATAVAAVASAPPPPPSLARYPARRAAPTPPRPLCAAQEQCNVTNVLLHAQLRHLHYYSLCERLNLRCE